MEYFLTRRRIYLLITFQTIIFLYSKRLAADPMWIWTQGCFQSKEEDSTNVFNMSYNLPHTCLQKCGQQSMVVALQGNLCRCEFKSKTPRVTSFCKPCEHNSMVMCGDSKDEDWSLYMKAKPQELTAHGIQTNISGCIINKNGIYRVENCSKTGIRSICKNVFWKGRTNCDSVAGKWSPLSCDNRFDNLADRFAGIVQGCSNEYWIGLFAIDKQLSHSTLSSYSQLPCTPLSSIPAESSVLLASAESRVLLASATDQVPDESVEVLFSSTYDTHAHTEELSTHVTLITENTETPSSKLLSILPTIPRQFETSSDSLSYLYSSFSESLPPYVDPSVITETLLTLPVLSQSELFFSITSTDSVSNRISFTAKTHISPTSAKSELSNNEYSSASISFTSVIVSRSGSIRASPEPSFRLSMLSSLKNERDGTSTTALSASTTMDGISSTAVSASATTDEISTTAISASTTVMLATQQISPTPSYNTQKYSSEADLVVAVYVLSAIAAISLASAGVVYVYMKRSQTNMKKILSRKINGDRNREIHREHLSTNSTYSGTSYCTSGIMFNPRSYENTLYTAIEK